MDVWDQYGNGWNNQGWNKCRHEPTGVFEHDGILYMGASESRINWPEWFMEGLIVCLIGDWTLVQEPETIHVPDQFKELTKDIRRKGVYPNAIVVKWPDMGTPPVLDSFWLKLHELAKKNVDPPRVMFYCVGGHGRTGTALSAMYHTLCGKPGGVHIADTVSIIREVYCNEAVESEAQAKYLCRLAGISQKESHHIVSPIQTTIPLASYENYAQPKKHEKDKKAFESVASSWFRKQSWYPKK